MVSTTFGRSTGFCIDPIEKKPLNQFYPGTAVLSFGTAGCNLGCKFCQNWSTSRSRDVEMGSEAASPATIARAAKELGCRSVAFTYNDPIVWAEYALETARACRELDIKTVAVTNGYITPAARGPLFELIDAANVDLKGFSDEFYVRLTKAHLDPVLDTLRWLVHESSVWVEITTLVIPGENDDPQQLQAMCRWIIDELGPNVPLHFTAFHPDFELLDRPPTPSSTLDRAHEIARTAGLNYVYTGNVNDPEHQATYCPACHRPLIERRGYEIGRFDITGGCCRHCGQAIAGHFDEQPGEWGARRQPVRIAQYARPVKPARNGSAVRPTLTAQEERQIFLAASSRVAAAVRDEPPPAMEELLGDIGQTQVYGAFVSLKRAGQLRSCCGFLGQSISLAEALDHAAVRAAKDDPRFPPISASELGHLDVDVWLLWGLEPVRAKGEDRVGAIVIGKHGLQIAQGSARGLLLPGVAVDHQLNARQFLEQVCIKAGLPRNAWKHDDTTLMTFEGYSIHGSLETPELATDQPCAGPSPADLNALADFCRQNLASLYYGATPSFYLPGVYDEAVCAVAVGVEVPGTSGELQASTFALRAEKPLQSTLFSMVQALLPAVKQRIVDPQAIASLRVNVTVLTDPAMHGTAEAPDLAGLDPRQRAILVVDRSRSAWIYDPERSAEELLADAVSLARAEDRASTAVFSMRAASTATRAAASYQPQVEAGPPRRPPAVAGMFYPGSPQEIRRAVEEMLPRDVRPGPWAAAMVPHAGWVYSGRLAAATLSRVSFPRQVIVFCPKHRAGGAEWAVAPHAAWSLPDGEVASDPELARQLAASIGGLELDAYAHRQEHAIEVQLPIIARLAPSAQVVGIVIGGGGLSDIQRFGEELAHVLGTLPERPLLVISSDLNHYAADAQTRRIDRHVLDALESLDPVRLYDTVTTERISMCGVLPAVIVMETLRHLGVLNRCEVVGYTTSAEASGDTSRVVGYAGVLFG
jgi:AmmeMemoRadiSam system radical SAM enzyme/AmmeMemoRadiSam system protein B/AmmeMemoRadiSam system protein A